MKKMVVLVFTLSVLLSLVACGSNDYGKRKAEQFEWADIEMHEVLPTPKNTYGEVGINSETHLSITLCDIDEETFNDYRDECINKGYTIDSEESDGLYSAFNENGYSVRLIFYVSDSEMNLYLDAPEEMAEFEWPTYGLGAMLPATKSTLGDISWNNAETFIVHVGNMTIDDYKDYVKGCEDIGFIVDYSKDEEYFSAKNESGYELTLRYLGFNRVEISLDAPEEITTTASVPPATQPVTESAPVQDDSDTDGIDPDFKAAMDSYEQFMDEYIDFMKKYMDNPSDLSLLSEYGEYMGSYAEVTEDFAKWQDKSLNAAETAYYIEVQTRVNQKLLEVLG